MMALGRDQVVEALADTEELPSFPEVVLRMEREIRSPDASVARVARIVQDDPAMAARFLRVANSPFYRRSRAITSIKQAVGLLGLAEVRRLALASAVVGRYKEVGSRDPKAFWIHSIAVALATQITANIAAERLTQAHVDGAYVAGLLHDLGVLAMVQLFPEAYQAVTAEVAETGAPAWEVEVREFGIHHGEVGAILAERWELPEPVRSAIHHHHQPWLADDDHRKLVQLVHFANFACSNQGFDRLETGFPMGFDDGAWEGLGLTLEQVPEIIDQVKIQGERSEVFWDLSS